MRRPLDLSPSQPPPQPDQRPGDQEDHQDSSKNAKAVPSDNPTLPTMLGVKEGVGVEAFGVEGDVRDAEVE